MAQGLGPNWGLGHLCSTPGSVFLLIPRDLYIFWIRVPGPTHGLVLEMGLGIFIVLEKLQILCTILWWLLITTNRSYSQ